MKIVFTFASHIITVSVFFLIFQIGGLYFVWKVSLYRVTASQGWDQGEGRRILVHQP